MPGREFFARMGVEFAEHEDAARENADRQTAVERLVTKAEYEFKLLRRDLSGLLDVFDGAVERASAEAAEVA